MFVQSGWFGRSSSGTSSGRWSSGTSNVGGSCATSNGGWSWIRRLLSGFLVAGEGRWRSPARRKGRWKEGRRKIGAALTLMSQPVLEFVQLCQTPQSYCGVVVVLWPGQRTTLSYDKITHAINIFRFLKDSVALSSAWTSSPYLPGFHDCPCHDVLASYGEQCPSREKHGVDHVVQSVILLIQKSQHLQDVVPVGCSWDSFPRRWRGWRRGANSLLM